MATGEQWTVWRCEDCGLVIIASPKESSSRQECPCGSSPLIEI